MPRRGRGAPPAACHGGTLRGRPGLDLPPCGFKKLLIDELLARRQGAGVLDNLLQAKIKILLALVKLPEGFRDRCLLYAKKTR